MRRAIDYLIAGAVLAANLLQAYKTFREIQNDRKAEQLHKDREKLEEDYQEKAKEIMRRHR